MLVNARQIAATSRGQKRHDAKEFVVVREHSCQLVFREMSRQIPAPHVFRNFIERIFIANQETTC